MRLISELGENALRQLAAKAQLGLQTGPLTLRIGSDDPAVLQTVASLYRYSPAPDLRQQLPDITINLHRPYSLRRWWRPQIIMRTDAQTPFEPFPRENAYPLLEWSYNWCIASQSHQFLMLHAAVVEKDGYALVMPALPGSGKSTLCAALMLRGWRLLSDEFAMMRPEDPELRLHPLPRPIPLKNRSIDVIREFDPSGILGPVYRKTRKGDVAHVMASEDSQRRYNKTVRPAWFLFPQYQSQSTTQFQPLEPSWTFLKISNNSFNYKLQGARGFRAVAQLVREHPAHALSYSDLDDAIPAIEQMHQAIIEAQAKPAAE